MQPQHLVPAAGERGAARDEEIQQAAQGVQVGPGVDAVPPRGQFGGETLHRAPGSGPPGKPGDTRCSQDDAVVLGDDDVAGADIRVDQTGRMQRLQRFAQLYAPGQHPAQLRGPVGRQRAQRPSGHVLHQEIACRLTVQVACPVALDSGQTLCRHPHRAPRPRSEGLPPVGGSRSPGLVGSGRVRDTGQHLHRHGTFQPHVPRLVRLLAPDGARRAQPVAVVQQPVHARPPSVPVSPAPSATSASPGQRPASSMSQIAAA